MNKNYDVSKIEGAVWTAFVGGVISADRLFTGSRPSGITSNSFIVINVVTNLYDKKAYGTCNIAVDIYAKDLTGGRKDAATLMSLHDKVIDVLPIKTSPYYIGYYSEASLDDGLGYHITKIYLDCIVTQTV